MGKRPSRSILRLGSSRSDVIVTGRVDDIRPYMEQAQVYVVPMRMGGGVRMKLLEAMAMKVPVVSTTIGSGGHQPHAERSRAARRRPAAFAHCVLRLLDDAEESRRLAGNARKLVEEHYDWNLLTPGLAAVYRRIEARQ